MSERVYNFQDILYVTYYDEGDSLTIDMTWSYLNDNAPYNMNSLKKNVSIAYAMNLLCYER